MICILVLAPCLVTGWGRFMDRCLSSSTVNSPALQCRLQTQGLWCWAAPACGQVCFRQHRNPCQPFSNGGLLKILHFQPLFITPLFWYLKHQLTGLVPDSYKVAINGNDDGHNFCESGHELSRSPRDKLGTKHVCVCCRLQSFDFRTPKDQGDY